MCQAPATMFPAQTVRELGRPQCEVELPQPLLAQSSGYFNADWLQLFKIIGSAPQLLWAPVTGFKATCHRLSTPARGTLLNLVLCVSSSVYSTSAFRKSFYDPPGRVSKCCQATWVTAVRTPDFGTMSERRVGALGTHYWAPQLV